MARRLRYAVPAAALALALAGCGGSDEPSTRPSDEPSTPQSPQTPSTTPTSGSPNTPGGTSDSPRPLEPTARLLTWQPVPGSVDETATTNGEWTLRVSEDATTWTLDHEMSSRRGSSVNGWRVSDALLDEDWAVVVLQDETEQQPSRATVTDLSSRRTFDLDGGSDLPTVNGGAWALGEDQLVHATVSKGAYCLASVDLETQRSTLGWCAPKRHGFNAAHLTEYGTSLLTFDDSQPSCRTVTAVTGTTVTPFPGVRDCAGWEGALTEDGAVWSVIPNERRSEEAHYYARVGEDYLDLGPGTSGTLAWCDDAAYFVRDPQGQGDPAALMRWSPDDGLSVAYQSPKGQAFLEAPRCGGEAITITARTSTGDEQVTADLDDQG